MSINAGARVVSAGTFSTDRWVNAVIRAYFPLDALGVYAAPDQLAALGIGANTAPVGPDYATTPTARYLNMRASTIYGGSSEVQHNIMARAALGL